MQVRTIAYYNRPFPYGGAESVTRNLAYFFHACSIRVLIYTSLLQEELLTEEDRQTFEIRVLPDPIDETREKNVEFLQKSLVEERVDVMIVQCMQEFPFTQLRQVAPKTRFIFCLHGRPLWEIQSWLQQKSSEIPNPTFLRRFKFIFLYQFIYRITGKLKRRCLKSYSKLLSEIDCFVSLCPQYSEHIQSQLLDYARYAGKAVDQKIFSRKFTAIANPLLPAEEPTVCLKEKVVLFVGRLQKGQKRVDRLLKIWKRIERRDSEWRLILVGDGNARSELEQQALRLRLKRVEFTGYCQNVAEYYRRATFVCLTSNFEGAPMCFTEGLQYGCIPVSFDSYASIQEITANGSCGIIVPAFSLRKYATALETAMRDEELQRHMRTACYEAARRYDLESIGAKWLRLFEKF